jgi:hypothetical protein
MPDELPISRVTAPPSQGGFNFTIRENYNPQLNMFSRQTLLDMQTQESIVDFTYKYQTEYDAKHAENMKNIDGEIDKDVKDEGGTNTKMSITTPEPIVAKEHVIHVKLYYNSKALEKAKADQAASLNFNPALKPHYDVFDIFPNYEYKNAEVRKQRLVDWAQGYEAIRLSQVYAEKARRLNEKVQDLSDLLKKIHSETQRLLDAEARAGRKEVPMVPPGVSLDKNMRESKDLRDSAKLVVGGESALVYGIFYTKVRNGGEWDYKQHGAQYEEVGNFNYGATGHAAGIPEQILLRAAGAAQGIAGTSREDFSKWWANSPYGDDKVDQVWIKAGIEFAKSKGF